jgi:hypothetical protein
MQRKCACGSTPGPTGECEACRKNKLQRRSENRSATSSISNSETSVLEVPPMVHDVLRSPGQPLDSKTRAFMEPRFGHDFSHVRVHADAQAAKSAQSLHASAYTVGNDVVFAAGQYSPQTSSGRGLLAHELTHTIQQQAGVDISGGIDQAGDTYERHADAVAKLVVEGESVMPPFSKSPVGRLGGAPQASFGRAAVQFQKSGADLLKPKSSTGLEAQASGEQQPAKQDMVEAGLLALGYVLQSVAAPEAQTLRDMYNIGKLRIEAEKASLIAKNVAESDIAKKVADMRYDLATDVRKTGSALMRKGAELIDAVRGQARPTYESLRAAKKSDAAIIESAARTSEFVNKLPAGMKWTGRTLWFVSIGLSIYVVVNAPPSQRSAVAQKEIEGTVGAVGGAAAGEAICMALAIATDGLGLIVCGLLGAIAGSEAARKGNLLQILDIAPHDAPELAGRIFRIEGDWKEIDLFVFSIPLQTVSASENVLVVATGMVSGEQIGGRGHYRGYEVTPANEAALKLFGSKDARFIPQYLLKSASAADLKASKD